MLKNFAFILILIFCVIGANCSLSSTPRVGDIFAFDNKDKTFHIVRVLEIDDKKLYINIYGNVFNEFPKNVKLEDLFVSLPCKPGDADCQESIKQVKDELNLVSFEKDDSFDENWKYVGSIPVTDDEKQKVALWKEKLRGLTGR